ncbi:MAG: putative DNA binding domain-containing protein [Oscillospiraceae bacterium]|jgi:ATP-dependent DNA helicase RecG|nr:putative DNA binding domain-containing protein [Oscillospiraceae bacterium]
MRDIDLNADLLQTLRGLIANWENEVIEFKQASNDYKQDTIGQYFSAISNEANLKGLQYGWLVFGVHNKTRRIEGSDYRDKQGLESLKHEIADNTTDRITFIDIFEVYDKENRRIVMFKIPAAVPNVPTAWKGHWYGREGESLGALSPEELGRLRGQARRDWSKQLIDGSGIQHLDAEAIRIAREQFKEKNEHTGSEIDHLTDEQFLTKLKLTIGGKLTNAAMVLLGNPDFDYLLDWSPRVMWRLYSESGADKDYEEFRIPFITVVDKVYEKIRNLTYRYMPNQMTLFPKETKQYDAKLLRELLNNCIAHQDYTAGRRIYLDEFEDTVVISNAGTFLPGDIREVLKPGYTAPYYLNQLLADAMMNFNMIDTKQMGIRMMFNIQRQRYFPMPDYDLTKPKEVAVRVYGKVLDENYTRLLFGRDDLDMETIFLLDCVQKCIPLETEQYKQLQKLGVIEGKRPNVFVSAGIADIVNERAQYIKNKAMDDDYYTQLIINYLCQYQRGRKSDFIKLLFSKLSDVLDAKQKENKVRNILTNMRQGGIIERADGNQRTGYWVLTIDYKNPAK